jgi:hypothetical protein
MHSLVVGKEADCTVLKLSGSRRDDKAPQKQTKNKNAPKRKKLFFAAAEERIKWPSNKNGSLDAPSRTFILSGR